MEGERGIVAAEHSPVNPHASGIIPTLQNIVATVNLSCKLDLKVIAMGARNAEYNPKRFAAVIMRIREPKTTALIFASGKMVSQAQHRAYCCTQAAAVQLFGVLISGLSGVGGPECRSAQEPRAKRPPSWLLARWHTMSVIQWHTYVINI